MTTPLSVAGPRYLVCDVLLSHIGVCSGVSVTFGDLYGKLPQKSVQNWTDLIWQYRARWDSHVEMQNPIHDVT